jgi:Family of unknown function (DUF5996)
VLTGTRTEPLAPAQELPPLPLAEWRATKDTLHLYVQIVGKIRLATTPLRNHWWNAPLYVDPRGLTTRAMRQGGLGFSIDFDFIDHALRVRTDRGETRAIELRDGLTVAEFHDRLMMLLHELGIDVAIRAEPFGLPMTTPFADDREHASYDAGAVERWWRIIAWADWVFEGFSGWFSGKSSPVHLFWHSLDLAVTRFSGRPAPAMPDADAVTREAYCEEVISMGLWAGDDQLGDAAFYSYTAPEPAGLADQPLQPDEAFWLPFRGGNMALLRYDAVRTAPAPHDALLRFLQSAYDAGAKTAGWPAEELRSNWCPPPGRLEVLAGH